MNNAPLSGARFFHLERKSELLFLELNNNDLSRPLVLDPLVLASLVIQGWSWGDGAAGCFAIVLNNDDSRLLCALLRWVSGLTFGCLVSTLGSPDALPLGILQPLNLHAPCCSSPILRFFSISISYSGPRAAYHISNTALGKIYFPTMFHIFLGKNNPKK